MNLLRIVYMTNHESSSGNDNGIIKLHPTAAQTCLLATLLRDMYMLVQHLLRGESVFVTDRLLGWAKVWKQLSRSNQAHFYTNYRTNLHTLPSKAAPISVQQFARYRQFSYPEKHRMKIVVRLADQGQITRKSNHLYISPCSIYSDKVATISDECFHFFEQTTKYTQTDKHRSPVKFISVALYCFVCYGQIKIHQMPLKKPQLLHIT